MAQVGAAVFSRNYNDAPNGIATLTGTVEGMGRNSISIYGEVQKRVVRFVYLEQGDRFHKGDYVRVYYHPIGAIVVLIKRMTIFEYKKHGQNLGYISR